MKNKIMKECKTCSTVKSCYENGHPTRLSPGCYSPNKSEINKNKKSGYKDIRGYF